MNYDSFSSIYDQACEGVEGDVEFFKEKAIAVNGRVLEVGSGTGRIYIPLHQAGVDIIGIDTSIEMLELLNKKIGSVQPRPELIRMSINDIEWQREFDLIILPYRMFMHVHRKEEQLDALRRLEEAVTEEGEIIIDLFNPNVERIESGSNFMLIEHDTEKYVWLWEEFDTQQQVVNNVFRVERTDETGRVLETINKNFNARWFYPEEFRSLVESTGLEVRNVLADYEGKPFTGSEDKMIWILGRKLTS